MKGPTEIPIAVKKSLADLHQLFPERALGLIHALRSKNKQHKKFTQWREDQIAKLGLMVVEAAMDLERAYFEKRITTLGWATRNLLELSIWIDYCNLSDGHAKKFSDDRMRDLYGLSEAAQRTFEIESGVKSTEMDRALDNLTHFAESAGIQTLGDDFKRVSDAARELGHIDKDGLGLGELWIKCCTLCSEN
jgi:hypothetical protein